MRSILIIKTSAIGDVVHTFPMLEYLRVRFPKARIDWVVEKEIAPLLNAHPLLSHVIPVNTRGWRKRLFLPAVLREVYRFCMDLRKVHYDVLFDVQGNMKSAMITLCARASVKVGYGWDSVRERLNVLATDVHLCIPNNTAVCLKHLQLVQRYFEDTNRFISQGVELCLQPEERLQLNALLQKIPHSVPCLMVACGSKWKNKQLSHATLAAFIHTIATHYPCSFLFVYGNETEREWMEMLAEHVPGRGICVGGLKLPLWQALMRHIDGVIAVDSAALHLCSTTLTPSFSVFGPTRSSVFKPIEERHVAIEGNCPYGQLFERQCPRLRTCPTGACIQEIDPNALFHAFQPWFLRDCL